MMLALLIFLVPYRYGYRLKLLMTGAEASTPSARAPTVRDEATTGPQEQQQDVSERVGRGMLNPTS